MEEFSKNQREYTHENPCEFCGFPVVVGEHKPEWCENARENLETEKVEQKALTDEEIKARGKEFTRMMEEIDRLEKKAEMKPKLELKPESEPKKPIEEKKKIPEKLEKIIFILTDKINRKVGAAAGGLKAKEVKGEYERNWIENFLSRIINEQKEKTKLPADWLIILEELEFRVIDAAKEFVKKYREKYQQTLEKAGIL